LPGGAITFSSNLDLTALLHLLEAITVGRNKVDNLKNVQIRCNLLFGLKVIYRFEHKVPTVDGFGTQRLKVVRRVVFGGLDEPA